jgi:hypothetical protein
MTRHHGLPNLQQLVDIRTDLKTIKSIVVVWFLLGLLGADDCRLRPGPEGLHRVRLLKTPQRQRACRRHRHLRQMRPTLIISWPGEGRR